MLKINKDMDKTKMKLTLETENFKQSWESPYEDEDLESLCQAFFGLCIANGWSTLDVCKEMLDFAQYQIENLKSCIKEEEKDEK